MRKVLVCVLLAAAGCAKGDRVPVSGTVTVGGEPVRGGFVTIEPAGGAAAAGPQGYAKIRDGAFDTRDGGEPAVPGPVVVRVQGWGAPSERFPNGAPVCANYEFRLTLEPKPGVLELAVPESVRVREPKEGWGSPP